MTREFLVLLWGDLVMNLLLRTGEDAQRTRDRKV